MSLISDVWSKVQSGVHLNKVWGDASTALENWVTTLANTEKTIASVAIAEIEGVLKQGLSDAISVADSALGPHALPIAHSVETALETALAGATGGLSVPFNSIISAGIDDITNIAVTAAHAWALQAKAALAKGQPVPASVPPLAAPPAHV